MSLTGLWQAGQAMSFIVFLILLPKYLLARIISSYWLGVTKIIKIIRDRNNQNILVQEKLLRGPRLELVAWAHGGLTYQDSETHQKLKNSPTHI
jgi:hypothetical protein